MHRYGTEQGLPDLLSGEKASVTDLPLVADPGTRWEYGVNTDWLGFVIEEITGQTLGEYLTANVFEPLGMTETTFRPSDELRARAMDIHARQADGSLAISDIEMPDDPEFDSGGAGAYSTARDYARFLRALLRGGELDGARVLKAETVDLMLSDHLRGATMPELMDTAVPELTNPVPALPWKQGWGLGFHLTLEDVPTMRKAGTGDWAGLFNCYYWLDRESGVAALIMTQVLPFFDMGVIQTLLQFEQATYAQVTESAPA
jgi:CubicO group peptidase (beta-lactamase class C family)